MINMSLMDAARFVDGKVVGRNTSFHGCSTDTRTLQPDELFIAIKGPRFDGHDFIAEANKRKAAGMIAQREAGSGLSTILVADSRRAMGRLAAGWRDRFPLKLLAITGSNGKTTVKEMLTAILSRQGRVLATRGNLNNDIGVPLTLFGLDEDHEFAVIEMGANHPGEIAGLCRIACPQIAVVTQCAPAHLEGFGNIEGVAKAKGEIFAGLPPDGVAVINADDPFAEFWRTFAGTRRVVTFGLSRSADVTAVIDEQGPIRKPGSRFELLTPSGQVAIQLPLAGRHNVMNALAAAACASVLGVSVATIRQGLEAMRPVKGRLELKPGRCGCRVLDDSYNANLGSFKAALDVLGEYPGECWIVIGDMGELGREAPALHHQVGQSARAAGVNRLYAMGELSRHAVEGFGEGALHFDDAAALARALSQQLRAGVTILVKGSRAAQMEHIVTVLTQDTRS